MKFNSFLVGELFDIHPTTAYKMGNDELFSHKGTTLVLSNSSANNGIGGYCGLAPTEQGGVITFSDTTTGADTMFYQADPLLGTHMYKACICINVTNGTTSVAYMLYLAFVNLPAMVGVMR